MPAPFAALAPEGPAPTIHCLTKGDRFYAVWSVFDGSNERFDFNELQDDAGAWDKRVFATAPTIKSVAVASPNQRLQVTKFWPDDNGGYWTALFQRTGATEASSGTIVSFGRSTNGTSWTFDDNNSCSDSRCLIPDFLIVEGGYVYVYTKRKVNDPTKITAEFYFNLIDGDPTGPSKVALTLDELVEDLQNPLKLHLSGKMVGMLYWANRQVNDPSQEQAELKLQRFELKD